MAACFGKRLEVTERVSRSWLFPLVWSFKSCRSKQIKDNNIYNSKKKMFVYRQKTNILNYISLRESVRLELEDNIIPDFRRRLRLCNIRRVYSSVCQETFKSYLKDMFPKQKQQVHLTKEFAGILTITDPTVYISNSLCP